MVITFQLLLLHENNTNLYFANQVLFDSNHFNPETNKRLLRQ